MEEDEVEEEAATAHDSMQVPTSATGHEEEPQAAAMRRSLRQQES